MFSICTYIKVFEMVLLGVLLGTSSEKVGRIKSAFLTKVTCSVVTTGIPLLPLYSISNVWSQHVSFSPLISIVHMVIARLMLLLWVYGACFEQHLQQSHLPLKFVLPPHISGYGPFTLPPPPNPTCSPVAGSTNTIRPATTSQLTAGSLYTVHTGNRYTVQVILKRDHSLIKDMQPDGLGRSSQSMVRGSSPCRRTAEN